MWGTVAEWFLVVTSSGALGAAVWAGITSKRLLLTEQDRDVASREREKREQASQISSWCVFCPENEGPKDGLLVRNGSPAPIFGLIVDSADRKGQAQPPLKASVVPPGEYLVTRHEKYNWSIPESTEFVSTTIRPISKSRDWAVRSVVFRDSYGIRWERRDDGVLVELDKDSGDGSS